MAQKAQQKDDSFVKVELKDVDNGEGKEEKKYKSKFLQLFVSCKNLRNLDFFSKSDPMAILFVKHQSKNPDEPSTGLFHEIGRTNMVKDNLSPEFYQPVVVNIDVYKNHSFRWIIADIESPEDPIVAEDVVGQVDNFRLAEVLNEKTNYRVTKSVKVGTSTFGLLQVQGEFMVDDYKTKVRLQFAAENVPKYFLRSMPHFIILRRRVNRDNPLSTFYPIYITEAAKSTTPYWKEIVLPYAQFCNGLEDEEVQIQLHAYGSTTSRPLVGFVTVKAKDLLKGECVTLQVGSTSLYCVGEKFVKQGMPEFKAVDENEMETPE